MELIAIDCDKLNIEIEIMLFQSKRSFLQIVYYIIHNRNQNMISLYPFITKTQQSIPTIIPKDPKSKFHNLQQLKNVQMINPKLIAAKKQTFPEIQSPFLKKTVTNLFPSQNVNKFKRGDRLINNDDFQRGGMNLQNRISGMQKIQIRQQCISQTDQLYRFERRIGKSFSQTKKPLMHFQDMTPEKLLALRKSEKKIYKTATQGSVSTSTSKEIYQKLNSLNQKDKLSNIQSSVRLNESHNLKQYKCSNFVLKYKLATSLHQQKMQLRNLKGQNQYAKSQNLRENIKIKNYRKFTDFQDIQL